MTTFDRRLFERLRECLGHARGRMIREAISRELSDVELAEKRRKLAVLNGRIREVEQLLVAEAA